MSLPPWVAGVSSTELPFLGGPGTRDQLLETFRRESDPGARVTALRALIALEVAERRSGSGAADLAKLLESCASDPGEEDVVRGAAVIGLPFVSMARARVVLPGLLDSSSLIRSRALDLLEAITFLEMASFHQPADPSLRELRAALRKQVADLVDDPATSPENRSRAEALLKNPEP